MFYNTCTIQIGCDNMGDKSTITNASEEINLVDYSVEEIENLIYNIRGKQVMLDSDVAMLYHYETKKINQAVKRNLERFPEEFCFRLTEEEKENMWSQIVTASKNIETNKFRNKKYLPYVFTEQGIAMLSGLLKNDIAVQVSINIINAFVSMRRFLLNNGQVFQRLTNVEYTLLEQGKVLSKHEKQFEKVFDELQKNKNVEVIILTSPKCKITKLVINKFNKQYPSIKIVNTNKFHDKFIVIDDKELYHIRSLFKRFR